MKDLKERLGRIIVAYSFDGKPVTANDLQATGAMAALLKDALKPNLIQTLEHTPAIVHGGPFANIAHGCNSVRATKASMKLADITITDIMTTSISCRLNFCHLFQIIYDTGTIIISKITFPYLEILSKCGS